MRRARVVHLTTVHAPFDPRIFWKQAVSLRRAGYEVYVVAQHTRAETLEGVHLLPLSPVRGRYRRVALQREAFTLARSLEADVYHFHDPELLPLTRALKRVSGARIVYDMHEDYRWHGPVEGRLLRRLEQWGFGWLDHVVVAEEAYAAFVPEQTPQTVVLNYFRPFAQQAPTEGRRLGATYRLLSAGVLAGDRGLGVLLDVVARAQGRIRPWQLTLAGVCYRKRDRHLAEQQIRQEGLRERVRRIGWDTYVPWQALEPHYAEADVGLALFDANPNYLGSVPTKFYEYLFYGLPILCSDFPLWRQFIEHHRCGAVVAPGDAAQAFEVLREWDEQPARYEQLSAAAARAASCYQWSVMETRLLALYESLLDR